MPAIGIDLGTSNSCVGVWRAGKVDIIPNIQGNRTTPSCVAFTKTVRHFGVTGDNQAEKDPANAVFHSKRLIGVNLKHSDTNVLKALKDIERHWQFGVIEQKDKLKVAVEYQEKKQVFRPEEISAMVLRNLKETAETYLGGTVSDAVISVPASFNASQRQATLDAAEIAGLNVLSIMNEPTAAALAYGFDKQITGRNILIFDLGAGKLDVTIVTVPKNNVIKVKSTAGNPCLGGEDFDNRLVDYLVEEFKKTHGKDVRNKPRSLRRLKTAAERAKRNFSTSSEVYINIDALMDDIDFSVTLTRDWFEEYCKDLFLSILEPVKSALEGAKLGKRQIDDVLLVGGSTRILKIRSLLVKFFGKELNLTINSDEAVACGAAIHAAVLSGDRSLQDVYVLDVSSLNIYMQNNQGVSFWMKRYLAIPNTGNVIFQLCKEFDVYEGVNEAVKSSILRAVVDLPTSLSKEYDYLKVAICVDRNGIMSVSCFVIRGEEETHVSVTLTKDTMSIAELENSKRVSSTMGDVDRQYLEQVKARVDLESCIFTVISKTNASSMTQEYKEYVNTECDNAMKWLEKNQHVGTELFTQMRESLEATLATKQEVNKILFEAENYFSALFSAITGLPITLMDKISAMVREYLAWLRYHQRTPNQQLQKGDIDKKSQELSTKIAHFRNQNEINQSNRERANQVLQTYDSNVESAAYRGKISENMKNTLLKESGEMRRWYAATEQLNVAAFNARLTALNEMLTTCSQEHVTRYQYPAGASASASASGPLPTMPRVTKSPSGNKNEAQKKWW